MIAIFQTANGAWHWPSVLLLLGWLIPSAVTGAIVFANLNFNFAERVRVAALENARGPWLLTAEQRVNLEFALRVAPRGPVSIEYISMDAIRAQSFATLLHDELLRLGYQVRDYTPTFIPLESVQPLEGLQVMAKPEAAHVAGPLSAALEAVGYPVKLVETPSINYPDDYTVIQVWLKPDKPAR